MAWCGTSHPSAFASLGMEKWEKTQLKGFLHLPASQASLPPHQPGAATLARCWLASAKALLQCCSSPLPVTESKKHLQLSSSSRNTLLT